MVRVVVLQIGQEANQLLRLAHVRLRVCDPAVLPFAELFVACDPVLDHRQQGVPLAQGRMGVHVGGELVLGLGDAPPLHVDGQVLGDGDIEGVRPMVGDDQVGEAAEAGRPHARVLVEEETDFFGVADELLQMDEMAIEGVFRVDLGPFFGELLLVRRDVGGLDVQPSLGFQVGVLDLAFEAAGGPLGGLLDGGDLVVDREPDAGVLAEGRSLEAVAQGPGLPLRRLGVDVRVEVQVHAEAVAGRVVGAGHGREGNVPTVGPLGPVGDEVLAVDAQPEPLDRGVRKL